MAFITQADLDAGIRLLKLEDLRVKLQGRAGEVIPPAPIRYVGIGPQRFEMDLEWILKLVNLRLHEIESERISVAIGRTAVELRLAFEDHGVELTSSVGALDLEGIEGVVRLGFDRHSSMLQLLSARIEFRKVRGTGLLASTEVIRRAHQLTERVLQEQARKILESEELQSNVSQGLLTWARFQTAEDWVEVVPGSVGIDSGVLAFAVTH